MNYRQAKLYQRGMEHMKAECEIVFEKVLMNAIDQAYKAGEENYLKKICAHFNKPLEQPEPENMISFPVVGHAGW